MAPARRSTVQIEGKTFDLAADVVGGGGSVRIEEKGRRKSRGMVVPLTMARWVARLLGSAPNRVVGRSRFGRLEGWVRCRSNSRGRFLEIGVSGKGKVSRVFVPGRQGGDPWGGFMAALLRVVAEGGFVRMRSGGAVRASRSYRDVTVQGGQPVVAAAEGFIHRSRVLNSYTCNPSHEARAVAGLALQQEANKVAQEAASEVARVVAREVAGEVAREMARESEKMMAVLMDMVRGIMDSFAKGFGVKNDSQMGHSSEVTLAHGLSVSANLGNVATVPSEDLQGGSEGKGLVEDASDKMDSGSPSDSDDCGGGQLQGSGLDGEDVSDFHYDSEDDFLLHDQDKDHEDFGLVPSFVAETQSVDLEGVSLFDEEAEGEGIVILRQDDKAENEATAQQQFREGGVDSSTTIVEDTSKIMEERCLPTDVSGASVSFPREVLLQLTEIGCTSLPLPYQVQETPLKVFSRKKKGSRELKNLRTTINYDGGSLMKGSLAMV